MINASSSRHNWSTRWQSSPIPGIR